MQPNNYPHPIQPNNYHQLMQPHNHPHLTQTNTNVIIGSNNIIIPPVSFGSENFDTIITDEFCKKTMEHGINAIIVFIEHIHLNANHPEFHNCYVSNMRDNHAIIYNNGQWNLVNTNEAIEAMTNKASKFLENKYDKLKKTMTKKAIIQFDSYLNAKQTDTLDKIYNKDLKLMFYNKKNVVIRTRKTVEQYQKQQQSLQSANKLPITN
jgi:hypothetical protein